MHSSPQQELETTSTDFDDHELGPNTQDEVSTLGSPEPRAPTAGNSVAKMLQKEDTATAESVTSPKILMPGEKIQEVMASAPG